MVGLGTVKSVHKEAPYVNSEGMEKCHLSFNSHCRGYIFLEGRGWELFHFLTLDVKCHFLLKLLALVHLIIYSVEQDRINPQTLFLLASIILYLWLTSICRILEVHLIYL